jgi:hypothetical protein
LKDFFGFLLEDCFWRFFKTFAWWNIWMSIILLLP